MGDFHLLQALNASRDLAAAHEGEAWRAFDAEVAGVIDAVIDPDPPDPVGDADGRVERGRLEGVDETRVLAALRALAEDPTDERLATARDEIVAVRADLT
jgi:hypothetical protein